MAQDGTAEKKVLELIDGGHVLVLARQVDLVENVTVAVGVIQGIRVAAGNEVEDDGEEAQLAPERAAAVVGADEGDVIGRRGARIHRETDVLARDATLGILAREGILI
jgi:hypothetical protein